MDARLIQLWMAMQDKFRSDPLNIWNLSPWIVFMNLKLYCGTAPLAVEEERDNNNCC